MMFFLCLLKKHIIYLLKLYALPISLTLCSTALGGASDHYDLKDDVFSAMEYLIDRAEYNQTLTKNKSLEEDSTSNKKAFKKQKENMAIQNKAYQLRAKITAMMTKISISLNDGKDIYTNENNYVAEDLDSHKNMNKLACIAKTDLSILYFSLDNLSLNHKEESSKKKSKNKRSGTSHIQIKETSPMLIKFQEMINKIRDGNYGLNDESVLTSNPKEYEHQRVKKPPISLAKSTQTEFEIPDNNADTVTKPYRLDNKKLEEIHDQCLSLYRYTEKLHKKWFSNESSTQSQRKNLQTIRERPASAPPTEGIHTQSKDPGSNEKLRRSKSTSYKQKPCSRSMKNYKNISGVDISRPESSSIKGGLPPIDEEQNLYDKPDHYVNRERSSTISFYPSGQGSDLPWTKFSQDKARKRLSTGNIDEKFRFKGDTRANPSNSLSDDYQKKTSSLKRTNSLPIQHFKETSV